ncbi:Trans-enoyl reductase iccB [Fulvia fulva]|uniref:Trans-enoyl reductase iccB n=1 Tax=Passalora fulva TaxID=5499 RepID=A0A9Q8LIK7_PASFU|nr:Trans-enoyl reductase iccB [Fulvia fulva]KAK4624100.1 Trans-enoyl reductase iccB [Fulvia fulva]KAK4625654.1 Trans-enoyl reductase iccB [Fulvia fulva]UJO18071.1 Trans-enoyl reductase iccB [Fulvia fulva]WPV15367.1 Trans-enoyl reductase iccB [Fulvia fulva]WPV29961.1 Trans-enoyl reductase iccB [Fulvia fulva]
MAIGQPRTLPERQRAIKVLNDNSIALQEDVPLPPLNDEDVLVRVHCVALNPFDWKSLDLSPAPGSTFGCDVAGEVIAVGTSCRHSVKVGDRVFGPVKGNTSGNPENGGFAEYATIRDVVLWKIPDGMRFEHAATLGMSLMTVGLGLHYMLKVPLPLESSSSDIEGRHIFIYGAGTATGTLAVQCAALSGLRPIVACSPRHFDRMKSLGAVACFDYHVATVGDEVRDFTKGGLREALDCITDSASMNICYSALGDQGGRYVGLDQFPIRSHTRRDVYPEWIVAWTVSGEAIQWKRPYARTAKPKHKAFGQKWNPEAQKLLDSGRLQTHPIDLRSGGLAAIPDGIAMLRKGLTDGKKLVYSII